MWDLVVLNPQKSDMMNNRVAQVIKSISRNIIAEFGSFFEKDSPSTLSITYPFCLFKS